MSEKSTPILLPVFGKRKLNSFGAYQLAECDISTHGLFKDETGNRYHEWLVLKYAGRVTRYQHRWLCKCSCGTQRFVLASILRNGTSKSCGCLQRKGIGTRKSHGDSIGRKKTAEYRAWRGMKDRCLNKNSAAWNDYGGRGITVCDRWKKSFEDFLSDMGRKPAGSRISLHRINNDEGYSPKNCIWATDKIQANARRNNRLLQFGGKTKTVTQWSDALGISVSLILNRLKLKWSVERILTQPVRRKSTS